MNQQIMTVSNEKRLRAELMAAFESIRDVIAETAEESEMLGALAPKAVRSCRLRRSFILWFRPQFRHAFAAADTSFLCAGVKIFHRRRPDAIVSCPVSTSRLS